MHNAPTSRSNLTTTTGHKSTTTSTEKPTTTSTPTQTQVRPCTQTEHQQINNCQQLQTTTTPTTQPSVNTKITTYWTTRSPTLLRLCSSQHQHPTRHHYVEIPVKTNSNSSCRHQCSLLFPFKLGLTTWHNMSIQLNEKGGGNNMYFMLLLITDA